MKRIIFGAILALLNLESVFPLPFAYDLSVGSELDDYLHLLSISGRIDENPLLFRPLSYRTLVDKLRVTKIHPWISRYPFTIRGEDRSVIDIDLMPFELGVVYNTEYPYGLNDGELWAGRGVTAMASNGVMMGIGPVTVKLQPSLYYSQNRAFTLYPQSQVGVSEFGYPAPGIDWPQRYGDSSFYSLNWGQSGIRLDVGNFTMGFSTENMWWGPAIRNPIIMSNTGTGFPHLDIGLGYPTFIGIGYLDARLVWGRLEESEYFDEDDSNDVRLFSGMVLGYRPKWIQELTVGFSRVFCTTWDSSMRFWDFFPFFDPFLKWRRISDANPRGEDEADQLFSIMTRWRNPKSGFEVYVEWARNDHSGNLRDLFIEPEASRAFTIGLGKTFELLSGILLIQSEFTYLGKTAASIYRMSPTYYRHHKVTQGYTHLGQIIGAGIGPGSDSQFFRARYYTDWGRVALFFERLQHDADFYYDNIAASDGSGVPKTKDVTFSIGTSTLLFLSFFSVELAVTMSHELNRQYIRNNDATNWSFQIAIAWER